VFKNAAGWWPWFFFDWIWGRRIEVRCQEVPNPNGVSCANNGAFLAYVRNENGPQIVFCPTFFQNYKSKGLLSLKARKAELDGPDAAHRKDLRYMKTLGHIFLHEMTHLAIVEGRESRKLYSIVLGMKLLIEKWQDIIKDQPQDINNPSQVRVYGPWRCEAFARRFPSMTHLNGKSCSCHVNPELTRRS
jgi:hypothetical protein